MRSEKHAYPRTLRRNHKLVLAQICLHLALCTALSHEAGRSRNIKKGDKEDPCAEN
jgi:hypothetical protein